MLFDIASKGGNYLLNVGPTSEGLIPQESVDILAKVGDWMEINSECIYGTQASPFNMEFKWGNITQKSGKLYLGIFNWPTSDFYLEGLKNKVKKVYLLSDYKQKALPYKESYDKKTNHHRLKIELPQQAPDEIVSVVEIEGQADVETTICQQADRTILLSGISGEAKKDGLPAELKFTARGGGANWIDPAVSLNWKFRVEKPGTYQVDLVSTETGSHGSPVWEGGQKIKIVSAGQSQETTVINESLEYNQRSQYWKLIHTSAGKIEFNKPGAYELSLIPVSFLENKTGCTFKEIKLSPKK